MPKEKICDGCGKSRPIWKNAMVDGVRHRFCQYCWSCHPENTKSAKKSTSSKPIAPRSHKRSKEEKMYAGKRAIFMSTHQMCEANIVGLCTQKASEVHHKAGRIGDLLLDETKWMAVCRSCHTWIEEHPNEATEMGFRESKTNFKKNY